MKTEPTIQELREAAKNHPNTFLAGALYVVDLYASHPISAEPTVQQLREASKNNPDTFLAGALYVIDNYKLNSPLMSSEQYSSGAIHSLGEFPTTKLVIKLKLLRQQMGMNLD